MHINIHKINDSFVMHKHHYRVIVTIFIAFKYIFNCVCIKYLSDIFVSILYVYC